MHSGAFILFSKDNINYSKIYVCATRNNDKSPENFNSALGVSLIGLYNSSLYSDITLLNSDKDISLLKVTTEDESTCATQIPRKLKAHKAVLSNNSKYFKEMFSSGFKDSTQDEVLISCQQEVLEVIIFFIYTRTIKESAIPSGDFEFWHQVFENSRMMGLNDLSKISHWFSLCYISPSNAYRVLDMFREYKDGGAVYRDVLKYLETNWYNIPN